MRSSRHLLIAAVVVVVASYAGAAPLHLSFHGTGSGTVGATPFTDAEFNITLTIETTENSLYAPGVPITATYPTTIWIAGVGTGTFTTGKRVFDNQGVSVLGLNNLVAADLINLSDPAFATYDLTTPLGPILDPSPFYAQFDGITSSMGDITFTAMSNVTFVAAADPIPVAEPIPATTPGTLAFLALVCAAVAAFVLRRAA
jgi:hypothetical protein